MFHLLFDKVNKFYENLFERYGHFLSKHYIKIICLSIIFNLILITGLARIRMISDTDTLFMPVDSQAKLDEKFLKQIFNQTTMMTNDFYLHQILDFGTWVEINFQPCNTNNILNKTYLDEIARLNDLILNKTVFNYNNTEINIEDVCARRNGDCLVDGIDLLSPEFYSNWLKERMFEKDKNKKESKYNNNFSDDEKKNVRFYIKFVDNGKVSFNDLKYTLGKKFRINSLNESNNETEPAYAEVFKIRYNLKSNYENADYIVKQWELKLIDFIKEYIKTNVTGDFNLDKQCTNENNLLKLSFAASQSLDIEMANNIVLDIKLIIGTFILIISFATIIMSINSTCITSPGLLLPTAGILSAILGLLSSFGLLSYFNYPGCNLIFVIPFLVIGIGIDDMFIIYSSFLYISKKEKFNNINLTNEEIISKVIRTSLARSGVSITITSLTDFVAFLVGITTGFRSVQIFCVYAGFSIVICYLNQLTLFTGCLCLHYNRILNKKNSFLICLNQSKCINIEHNDDLNNNSNETNLRQENIELNANEHLNNTSQMSAKLNRKNSKYEKKLSNSLIYMRKFKEIWLNIFKFIIYTKRGKSIVCILFLIYISFFSWQASKIHEGINLADLVAQDSYYSKYIKDSTRLNDLYPIVMIVFYEPIDYDNIKTRIKIRNLIDNIYKIDGISSTFRMNWLDGFLNENIKLNYENSLDSLDSLFAPFKNDLIIKKIETDLKKNFSYISYLKETRQDEEDELSNDQNKQIRYEIEASRFYFQYSKLSLSSSDAKPMNLLRKVCKESGLPVMAYSVTFKFYEQFEETLPNILQSFIIAIEAMYLIALLFIPDLVSVLCIIITMISIMIGLIGSMHLWGLTLSSITMIELIMSIGFCVDFTAHLTHAFLTNGKGDSKKRAYKAIVHVGMPIFNSALSTFIGISLLAFCKSYIFISFFKTMTLLMFLGVLNSLVFLPVLLSLIGPNWPIHKELNNQDETKNNDINESNLINN